MTIAVQPVTIMDDEHALKWKQWFDESLSGNPDPQPFEEFWAERKADAQNAAKLYRNVTAPRLAPVKPGMELVQSVRTEARRSLNGDDLRGGKTVIPWAVVTADRFFAEPPATPPEILKGMLYAGGTMMLSGASKSRKTYTMQAAALAISTGHEWLGFQTAATPVIYLNLELQDFAMHHRLHSIAEAMGVKPGANLHLVNLRGQLVTIDALEARIAELIQRTGAGLVIIDPHYKLSSASGVEENSNDSQAYLLYRIESAVCSAGAR